MPRTKGAVNKHKKEKPHKEKKQKGRPKGSIKQKQKQEQHQIVNVNIGRRGNVSGEKKERKKQQQQPTIIFNPSLNIPSFSYGNRPPVNPSFNVFQKCQNLI